MFDRACPSVARLKESGLFAPLDLHLAGLLGGLCGNDPALALAAAMCSAGVARGDVCLDLDKAGDFFPDRPDKPDLAEDPKRWRAALERSGAVGGPDEATPLVLDGPRLYLRRYFEYERRVGDRLLAMASNHASPRPPAGKAARILDALFPRPPELAPDEADRQRLAAFTAPGSRLCVITGGPGTGKTTTAAKLLLMLLRFAGDERPRIRLAAPTGKAAARLAESMRLAVKRLARDLPEAAELPTEAATLHRLLGWNPGAARFRHHADNPLGLDVLVVDEVSMLDLPLMAKLLDALPGRARLVLLGDKDQLASVEAGSVMADICGPGDPARFSPALLEAYAETGGRIGGLSRTGPHAPPLADRVVQLDISRRFARKGGISALAEAILAGNPDAALEAARNGGDEIRWLETTGREDLAEALAPLAAEGYAPCFASGEPAEILGRFDAFRVLTPLHDGPFGTGGLNQTIRRALEEKGLVPPGRIWYPGRPVMVTRNDHALGLFNGDAGLALTDDSGETRVHFPSPDGATRALAPPRLPEHETVYAMTVHKSQGSEFDRVVLVLPPHASRAATRELLYTAVTRAGRSVAILGGAPALASAVAASTPRNSGLAERLWNTGT